MTEVTYIDLLRHGETENSDRFNGSTDNPLTELGWSQMQTSVENTTAQWQSIVTSPLIRCANFAEGLSKRHNLPVTHDKRFQEIHFGQWEGRSAKELIQTDNDALTRFWQSPMQNPPPQAEHLLNFEERILTAWHDINRQFSGKNILLITHSGVIRVILCHILQHPIEQLLEFEIEYAALKRIQITKHQGTMIAGLI